MKIFKELQTIVDSLGENRLYYVEKILIDYMGEHYPKVYDYIYEEDFGELCESYVNFCKPFSIDYASENFIYQFQKYYPEALI